MRGHVVIVSQAFARPFIETWHYSGRIPGGKNIFFAWFDDDLELYAVADYGIGVNCHQASFLARVTGLGVTDTNLLELKRLCRVEPKQDGFPLTAFLAECHRRLVKMGYEYIVSFSDPMWNHDGGVYKAANFVHLGHTKAEQHVVNADGVVLHHRTPYRYARANDMTIGEARVVLGLQHIKTKPKDRWFLPIRRISKSERRMLTARSDKMGKK